ncbi:MAG: hypothetical protein QF921_07325 [Pseudomonadales bacterium]|nr:hypothetical protein [Pseudomonadales bacterium]MDP6971311.1 hypothetical protein [Pseudomonadales bacterium]
MRANRASLAPKSGSKAFEARQSHQRSTQAPYEYREPNHETVQPQALLYALHHRLDCEWVGRPAQRLVESALEQRVLAEILGELRVAYEALLFLSFVNYQRPG